jgi:broad specificity phosphatase PhoE
MQRRRFAQAVAASLAWPATVFAESDATDDDATRTLRGGGCALLLRHAPTEAGIGDPPGYRLEDCSTQRNLSPEGRTLASRAGASLRLRGLVFDGVFSSRWCRCLDTASLMFPRQEIRVLEALNSFFDGRHERERQTDALRTWLAALGSGRRVALVTHQVNIMALTGDNLAMGEAVVVTADRRGDARSAGRIELQ